MYGLDEHEMMDGFTSFGFLAGAIFFVVAIITGKYMYLIPGLLVIFAFRLLGYFLDRKIERQKRRQGKQGKRR
ncbi:MAG: hypothetical protein J6P61_09065 [Erysipelotrichaceae bacterium]|nr:hypothetical protein [Erysipelotrichaceae bacterium]